MAINPHLAFAIRLSSIIASGDLSMAQTYYDGWCASFRWSKVERATIMDGLWRMEKMVGMEAGTIDAARFGCA